MCCSVMTRVALVGVPNLGDAELCHAPCPVVAEGCPSSGWKAVGSREGPVCGLHVAVAVMGLSLGLLICHPISFCPSPTSHLLMLCRHISICSQAQGSNPVYESMCVTCVSVCACVCKCE